MMYKLSLLLLAATSATGLTISQDTEVVRRDVTGNSFDRFVCIFLENQDYTKAIQNSDFQYLATQGITLTNYFALTHPSQPNYIAAVGGSTNGVTSNSDFNIASSAESIVDLLEAAGVSWATYQEDMPYTGFTGNWPNQQTGANDYVRKHNPLISYQSVTSVPSRLAKIQNFTLMYEAITNDAYPQWSFLTPNMTNDGHDTSLAYGASWARSFLTPLLSNPNFNTDRTLIVLTYDEGSYNLDNQVICILLGGVISDSAKGTTDNTAYNHYSLLKTVESNWNLGNLGKNDVGATAFF